MSWISLGPLGFPLNTRGRDVRFSRSWNISHSSSGTSFHFSLLFSIPPTLPPALSLSLALAPSVKPWSHPLPRNPLIVWNTFHSGAGLDPSDCAAHSQAPQEWKRAWRERGWWWWAEREGRNRRTAFSLKRHVVVSKRGFARACSELAMRFNAAQTDRQNRSRTWRKKNNKAKLLLAAGRRIRWRN